MTLAAYRDADLSFNQRMNDARAETAALLAMPPSLLTVMSRQMHAELAAIKDEIDTAFSEDPDLRVIATLEQAIGRLRAFRARLEALAEHARQRPREVPLPPPPPPPPFGDSIDLPIDDEAFREQLGTDRVSRYDAGILAELEHAGTPLAFVAHAYTASFLHALVGREQVACWLRASAPRNLRMTFRMRSGRAEQMMTPSDAIPLHHPLDASFLAFGQHDLVATALDTYVCNALLAIAWTKPSLVVSGGAIELAWSAERGRLPILPQAMLFIVTAIARRL